MPSKKEVAVVAAVVVGGPLAVGAAIVVLPLLGFGAAGVVSGTFAAGAHAAIGNVVAGSLFASLQSAGVLGLAVSTKLGIAAVGAAAGGVAAGAIVPSQKDSGFATGAQAAIGNVAAGGLFASLQRAGVVGLAAITKTPIATAGAIVPSQKDSGYDDSIFAFTWRNQPTPGVTEPPKDRWFW